MKQSIEYFGFVILTILGLVVSIFTLLLSFFAEGIELLKTEYKNIRDSSEENLKKEIKKKTRKNINIKEIKKNIKIIEKSKSDADKKISYLNPKISLIKTSVPLLLSAAFVSLMLSPFDYTLWGIKSDYVFLLVCLIVFCYALYHFLNLLLIIIEVASILSIKKGDEGKNITQLLSTIIDYNKPGSLFLKAEKVYIKINKKLAGEEKISFSVNNQHHIAISFVNNDEKMAKNIEIGLIMPNDFLIEKTDSISSITNNIESKIIRLKSEMVHSTTENRWNELNITGLKTGNYPITVFLKGENINRKDYTQIIEVVE